MFILNKYYTWYYNIVNRAKIRVLSNDTYIEKHHIIPKSLGGTDKKSNIVKLTAREHFICHLCLTKMTTNSNKQKMVFAMKMMLVKHTHNRYITLTSRLFESIKVAHSIAMKEMLNNPEIKIKRLQKLNDYWNDPEFGKIRRQQMSIKMKEVWDNDDLKKQQSINQKHRLSDLDSRKKMSDRQKRLHNNNPELCKKKSRPGSLNGMYNKSHSPETKHIIGANTKDNLTNKTYEDIYGKDRAIKIKNERSNQIKEYLKQHPDVRTGAKNSNAKTYKITSCSGEVYIVTGGLAKFCKNHKINCSKIIDLAKGRINFYKGWNAELVQSI